MTFFAVGLMAIVAANGPSTARAGQVTASPRFEAELMALARYNRTAQADSIGTLFIGSSSFRLWDIKADFAAYRPLNHGFGGATVQDVLTNYDLLTADYAPQTIVVYIGENDIAQGRDADAVTKDILSLLSRLRADYPKARLVYLSMKSSPARWRQRAIFEHANSEIRRQGEITHGFDYIDVSASLLLPGNKPDPECFNNDGLHLSTLGYARWRKIIDGYLTAPAKGAKPVAEPAAGNLPVTAPASPAVPTTY